MNTKTVKLLTIGGIVSLMFLTASAISTIVAYPSASHRNTAVQLMQLDAQFWSGENSQILDSKEYQSLYDSPQANYSRVASSIGAVIEFIISIIATVVLYGYLRRVRINKHPTATTTIIILAAVTLTAIALSYLQNIYLGWALPPAWQILATIGFSLTFGLLVTYTITRIVEWNYNRRHSFIVE